MKKTLLFASLFSASLLSAQWDILPTQVDWNFRGIAFTSRDSGQAVGADYAGTTGTILRTTDGGNTWFVPSAPAGMKPLNNISFFDSQHGCAVGDEGYVLLTTNGGSTWDTTAHFTNDNLYAVSFATITTIFAGGENGSLYRSYDAGLSWDTLVSGTTTTIQDMYFIHATAGWIAADGGYLGATGDGGDTFYVFAQPYFGFFQPRGYAYVGTTDVAFCVGLDGKAIMSPDAGLNWSIFNMPLNLDLNQVGFMNDLAGLICGENGFIYRTQDGGSNWMIESNMNVQQDLYDIAFAGDTTAFICGDSGRIVRNRYNISGIAQQNGISIAARAYPNPFDDVLTVSFSLAETEKVSVSITDLSGRIVFEKNAGETPAGFQSIRLDEIENLAAGMYLLRIQAGNAAASLPVIRR